MKPPDQMTGDRDDDGRRYALTFPRGLDPLLDTVSPQADHHAITVYGSADLAARVAVAHQRGVGVAWAEVGTDGGDRWGVHVGAADLATLRREADRAEARHDADTDGA